MTISSDPGPVVAGLAADPVRNPSDDPCLRRILGTACGLRDIDINGARLIHRYNNAVYLLPHESAIAKVTVAQSVDRVRTTQRITEWLAVEHGVAVTRPLSAVDPVSVDGLVVGFWRHYPQPDTLAPTSAHLARALVPLHQVTEPPVSLNPWVPLASLSAALADAATAAALPESDRAWLIEQVEETRTGVGALDWSLGFGIIHGDAWAGNLLWDPDTGPDRVVLGDWDNVCIGPREVDLIPTWHAAARYGRGPTWTEVFSSIY